MEINGSGVVDGAVWDASTWRSLDRRERRVLRRRGAVVEAFARGDGRGVGEGRGGNGKTRGGAVCERMTWDISDV